MKPLSKTRFDALAGYSRSPQLPLSAEELAWFEEADEKLLGMVSLDIHDRDYVYTVLGRDARGIHPGCPRPPTLSSSETSTAPASA